MYAYTLCVQTGGAGGGGRQNNFNKKQTSRREGRKHIKIRDRNMGTNKQGNKTTRKNENYRQINIKVT